MQITETLADGLKHEFKVVIGAEDMEQRLTDRLAELAKEIRMPGFRPGKVPVPVLRRTHGKHLLGEVLEQAVNETTTQALEERSRASKSRSSKKARRWNTPSPSR